MRALNIRPLMAIIPLVALAACNVTKDGANDQVTLEYNADTVEDAVADVGNAADEAATEVGQAAKDIGNKVENTDIDVDVKTDGEKAQANAN